MLIKLQKLNKLLINIVPQYIKYTIFINNELIIYAQPDFLIKLLYFLKNSSIIKCEQLIDIVGVDYPEKLNRFEIIYNLLSIQYNYRIKIKVEISELSTLPSCVEIYSAAGWYEREIWDLFGVFFLNHKDLRRILTDYGFNGHPLRKDFPLSGYTEVRYDEEKKQIISEKVGFAQEFRNFDFLSPWEQNYNKK